MIAKFKQLIKKIPNLISMEMPGPLKNSQITKIPVKNKPTNTNKEKDIKPKKKNMMIVKVDKLTALMLNKKPKN